MDALLGVYGIGSLITLVAWAAWTLNTWVEYSSGRTYSFPRSDARDVWNAARAVVLVPVWPVPWVVLAVRGYRKLRRAVRAADEARAALERGRA